MNTKRLFLAFSSLLSTMLCRTQNIDSFFAEPQIIELTISTPQPRLGETFQVAVDFNHGRMNIFKSLAGKVQISGDLGSNDNTQLGIDIVADKKGKSQMGPLMFTLDKTRYTTNAVSYEVVAPLPNTDRGLWFRKVMTSDSTFCIIIDQRIPAKEKSTTASDSTISFTTEPETHEIVKFKDTYSIEGVSGRNSRSSTNFSSVEIGGEDRQFMSGYSVYYFNISDKKAKIRITKDKFMNIPAGAKFEDIVIQ